MKCIHNDCGWCYASALRDTNAANGQCESPSKCPELVKQVDAYNIAAGMDAVADAPSEWKDEIEKTALDMLIYGNGFMRDGKRVDPKDVYISQSDEYEQSQHSAEEVIGNPRTDVRMAINDTLKAIHEEEDVVIKVDLKVHLSFLLKYERESIRDSNG